MVTGANKGQPDFKLTALDGTQEVPEGAFPLWVFDSGPAVRWVRTSEDKGVLLEAGFHSWKAAPGPARMEERAEWLAEAVRVDRSGTVTWMADNAATVVPDALREQATDVEWLEAETGLRHLGTETEQVVGSPYVVIHAPDPSLRQALSKLVPTMAFRHPRAILAEAFIREERQRDRVALAVHLREEAVDLVLLDGREGKGLQASVSHSVSTPDDAVYRAVHLLHSLGFGEHVAIQLSGAVKPAGELHRTFERHFETVDLHYGRFIPALGEVTGLHRQEFLPVIQLIRCA
jgi:hypothetical protein